MTRSIAARRALTPALLALALAFGAPHALAQEKAEEAPALETYDADTPLATVDGVVITLGDVISARRDLPAQMQSFGDKDLFDGLLDRLIQERVLAKAAEDAGVAEQPLVKRQLESLRRSLLAQAYVNGKIEAGLTDEALKKRYEEEVAKADTGEEVNARHILVKTEDEAKAIKAELDGGADFAALAKEKSTGPSGANGGSLGYFSKGQMVPEFEAAAFALAVGQVSEPVKSSFGWHVIKVEDRRKVKPPAFEALKDQLREIVARELAAAEVERLRTESKITYPDAKPPVSAVREDALIGEE